MPEAYVAPSSPLPATRPLIPEISVVMPAYNEEEVLPAALAEAVEVLEELCGCWEIIVVDDGSMDSTPKLLAAAGERDPRIRTVRHPANRGYGAALATGFGACRYQTLFYTDADAQFNLRDLVPAYPLLTDSDMVAGWRRNRQDPWMRKVASAVYNQLQAAVLGVRARDVDCAFKLFRRSFFGGVDGTGGVVLTSQGFLVDSELYARARRKGMRILQLPVEHRARLAGRSTIRPATVGRTLVQLFELAGILRAEDRRGA